MSDDWFLHYAAGDSQEPAPGMLPTDEAWLAHCARVNRRKEVVGRVFVWLCVAAMVACALIALTTKAWWTWQLAKLMGVVP